MFFLHVIDVFYFWDYSTFALLIVFFWNLWYFSWINGIFYVFVSIGFMAFCSGIEFCQWFFFLDLVLFLFLGSMGLSDEFFWFMLFLFFWDMSFFWDLCSFFFPGICGIFTGVHSILIEFLGYLCEIYNISMRCHMICSVNSIGIHGMYGIPFNSSFLLA